MIISAILAVAYLSLDYVASNVLEENYIGDDIFGVKDVDFQKYGSYGHKIQRLNDLLV